LALVELRLQTQAIQQPIQHSTQYQQQEVVLVRLLMVALILEIVMVVQVVVLAEMVQVAVVHEEQEFQEKDLMVELLLVIHQVNGLAVAVAVLAQLVLMALLLVVVLVALE
jgi:hypothetical protein